MISQYWRRSADTTYTLADLYRDRDTTHRLGF